MLPIQGRKKSGSERVGFFHPPGGGLALLQFNPGRCLFFGVVNGLQGAMGHRLSPAQLATAYQHMMRQLDDPFQGSYDPRVSLRRLVEQHGGNLRFRSQNLRGFALNAARAHDVVLLFQGSGTRSVVELPDGRIRVLNHFHLPSYPTAIVSGAHFVTRYEPQFPTAIINRDVVARILGIEGY